MAKSKAAGFSDRIKELRLVPASSLKPNPKNWRTHPQAQQDALRGILSEIGIADAVLARELPDGSLMLIDGHLRAETLGDGDVPVLILDVTESEADKILLLFDPLSGMAGTEKQKLDELLRSVKTSSETLAAMLEDLAENSGLHGVVDERNPDALREEEKQHWVTACPRCGGEIEATI